MKGWGQISNHVKQYLIEAKGNRCEQCGWAEVNPFSGKIPIEVDHIDGSSTNSSYHNLRLLCPNCHSLTSTFRNLNRGKGRLQRRKSRS